MVKKGNIRLNYPKGFFDLDEIQFKKYCDVENNLRDIASINGFELIKVSSAVYSHLNEYTHASIGRYYQIKDEKDRAAKEELLSRGATDMYDFGKWTENTEIFEHILRECGK